MARGPSTFRQKDVTRAIRAAFAAGATRAKVQVRQFTVTAEKGSDDDHMAASKIGENEWDTGPVGEGTQ
jgi:hypothetical protein